MFVTATDLRLRTREIFDAVARGEEITITYRGKPRARLVPVKRDDHRKIGRTPLFGIWKDYEAVASVDQYVRKLRGGRS